MDSGRLRVHVEEVFPLDAAARAHRRLEQGVTGKLVLTP
jgi:NADPH:quinone reductase-like Zn-dependent oxidoreductase